ncbi:PRC-barrel domain-containing protein [Cytophagaceae bacterium DM2B3-1]|uniref:PRC-barrel domain-containing protein n=1 Tax=Xanthocytophaga flava TaxID=3048013 RepID=A0ABT7CQJ8_9BACT|nr:PRC-barrel domain-containing protein [Xanthocytophaga flavus]MDJ1496019.1 PRC-barrel domain-containing protein [Xanthocytophaga flavus]
MAIGSYEADNQTGSNHEGSDANIPVQRLTATSIIGDSVFNRVDEELGTIQNLMVNIQTGKIEYAVLESGSFLGLGGKLFAIPFSELILDGIRRRFILDRSKEYVKDSPGFDKDHWPDTNSDEAYNDDAYYGQVNQYWQLSSRAFYP